MLVVAATVVAFGWAFGAALVALGAFARLAPQGWMVRDLGTSPRTRRLVMGGGLMLFVFATLIFLIVESFLV